MIKIATDRQSLGHDGSGNHTADRQFQFRMAVQILAGDVEVCDGCIGFFLFYQFEAVFLCRRRNHQRQRQAIGHYLRREMASR